MKYIIIIFLIKTSIKRFAFPLKQNKINYIRNYYKNIIYKIIKIRANSNNLNFYFIAKKIVEDLNNIFDIFDKIVKSDIKFYDPKFEIRIKNLKIFFNKFFVRFILIIVSLKFNEFYKISNLKRTINYRFRYKIVDKIIFTLYREFVKKFR